VAEPNNSQDRTEPPTPKRLREAREKGQVPRSRELATMLVLTAAGGAFIGLGPTLLGDIRALLRASFRVSRAQMFDPGVMLERLSESALRALADLTPLFVVVVIAAVIGNIALGGFSFSFEALSPKIEKISPISGLKRLFSSKAVLEFSKTLAKFLLVGLVVAAVLKFQTGSMLALGSMDLRPGLSQLGQILTWSFVAFGASLILVALIDAPFQLWDHNRQLRMTRQEIKDELKDTEGRPEVRSRIRGLQREIAQRRMMADVPKADVVITNPAHFAVALRYVPGQTAPALLAKGRDGVAAIIRQVAAEHHIPILRMPFLARAIYVSTALGKAIPVELYVAVAKVLAFVYQLKSGAASIRDSSDRGSTDIPDAFLHRYGSLLASLDSDQ